MTPGWTVFFVIAASLIASVCVVTGFRLGRREQVALLRSIDETRIEERRAAAYLEAAFGWHGYLQTLRPLAFPEEGLAANRQRDLATVLRARSQLEMFGSASVQQLHEQALDEAVKLIELLRSLPSSATTGEPDIATGRYLLRFVLGEVSKRVDALERQMNRELNARTAIAEGYVELNGRRAVDQEASAKVVQLSRD
jgi:hypothetical protein